MALSDQPTVQTRRANQRRAVGAVKAHWSDSQKIEAVTTFLMLGNVRLTSAMLKIPEFTIRSWMKTEWWNDTVGELKTQGDLQLSNKLNNLIAKSLDAISDRLDNGDWIYDQKAGELRRKPVSMKDAHKVAMDMVDKTELIRTRQANAPTKMETEDALDKLAKMFTDIATKKLDEIQRPIIEVTDVIFSDSESPTDSDVVYVNEQEQSEDDEEDNDALYEEWETGLQEGERALQQPTGADQAPLGTDDGSPSV